MYLSKLEIDTHLNMAKLGHVDREQVLLERQEKKP